MQTSEEILAILDAGSETYVLPMLDNGYVYLAATRLSLFRSASDWALVTEVFGFSPRAGAPDVAVATFASNLHQRDPAGSYVSVDAYQNYLRSHPHDDSRTFFPLEVGPWLDGELVVDEPGAHLSLRGSSILLPHRDDYARLGIELASPDDIHVYELCRFLASVARDRVLATPTEQRVSVLPEMERILVLDEWQHPNLVIEERPSDVESFQQLAEVLATGDIGRYQPTMAPNTHWRNWPDGGTL